MKIGHRVGFGRMLWILVAVLVCSVMFSAGRASAAAPSEDELYRRALLNAMEKCYNNDEMVSSVDVGGANTYKGFGVSVLKNGKESGGIYIPTGIGTGNGLALSKTDGTKIGCYELFLGDPEEGSSWDGADGYEGKLTGLLDLYNVKTPESEHKAGDPVVVGAFLKSLGYTVVEDVTDDGGDAADMTCLNISYRSSAYDDPDYLPLKKYCFLSSALDGSTLDGHDVFYGWPVHGSDYYYQEPGYGEYYTGGGKEAQVGFEYKVKPPHSDRWEGPEGFDLELEAWYPDSNGEFDYLGHALVKIADLGEKLKASNFESLPDRNPVKVIGTFDRYSEFKFEITHEAVSDDGGSAADMFTKYSMESWGEALAVARESLSGGRSAREFSDFDKYTLYVLYLKKVYGADLATNTECKSSVGSEDDVVAAVDGSTQKKYYIYVGSSGWCRIAPRTDKKEYKVSGFIPDERYILSTVYDFEGLVRAMYYLDTEEISANGGGFGGTSDGGSYGGDSSGGTVVTDPCHENAGSLGWAVCPLMNSLADSLGDLYDSVVEPFLVTNPELFPNAGGTHDAWNVMVGIANMLVVIFLLAVIFSQLTGVGIDNYGVKKILPKLIVVAVLVNLSYMVCQLAVDLSNILGNSLQGLLSGIDISLNSELSAVVGANGGGEAGLFRALFDIAGGGLVAIGVGSIIASVVSGGVLAGLIIPLLLLLVTAVIAVLFFFILLGVRKAGVVILVVLSPLAFVCYMLPNAKKWFDKWLKAFQGLLLVYPICGILIGGGQLTSKIILSASNDYVMYFTGCILMVVPFFFVPTLLKGSFAAMGNIGAKISGFGKNLGTRSRNRLDSGVKNSNWYKDRTKYNQDRAALRRANRTINRLNRRSGGNANNLSRRQRARMGTAMDVFKEQRRRELENRQKSGGNYVTAMMNKQDLEVDDAARDLDAYADAAYVNAKRAKSEIDHNENIENALLYNDADYAEGKRQQGILARDDELGRVITYADANYRAGKMAQSRLAWENDIDNTILYTRPGFESTKRRQYDAQRQSEVRKMYSEQFSKMSKAGRQSALANGLSGNSADAIEQVDAAFDSLMATGDVTEILGAFNGADFVNMDASVRERAIAKAAASGNQLLKGWAKTNGSVNLQDYINNTGANGFAQYLSTQAGEHAFDNADKDTLSFLASHGGAQAMSDSMLANIATTSANANQNATDAVIDLINNSGRAAGIGAAISAEGLTKMNQAVATAIGGNNLGNAVAAIKKDGNAQLRAKMDPGVARYLGVV